MAPVQRSPGGRDSGSPGCTEFLAALTNSQTPLDKAAALMSSRPAVEGTIAGTRAFLSGWKATMCGPASLANRRTTSNLRAESFSTSDRAPHGDGQGPVEVSLETSFLSRAQLPNLAGLLAHHQFALFAAEGLLKLRHIRKRSVAAEPGQRVRVGVGHQPCVFDALVGAPDLRPAEEETLLGSKAVFRRRPGLARQGLFIRGVGDGQAAQVGDAFP